MSCSTGEPVGLRPIESSLGVGEGSFSSGSSAVSHSNSNSNSSGSSSSINSNISKLSINSGSSSSNSKCTNNSSSKDNVHENKAEEDKEDIDSTAATEELLKVAERVFLTCFNKYDHLPNQLFSASRREEWELLQLHFKRLDDKIKAINSHVVAGH